MSTDITMEFEKLQQRESGRLHQEMLSELGPFLKGIKKLQKPSKEYTAFAEAYSYFMSKLRDKKALFASMLPTKYISSSNLEDNFYMLFLYLGMVESIGNTLTNMLVMLLVTNGRPFWCTHKKHRRKIGSIKELENVGSALYISLGRKLDFLEKNGLREFTSVIDKDFRNDIGHLEFQVQNDIVYVRGKDAYVEAFTHLGRLKLVIDIIEELLKKAKAC